MSPSRYRDTKDHRWTRSEGAIATIGIAAYAQRELSDVVFVELPNVDALMDAASYKSYIETKAKENSA